MIPTFVHFASILPFFSPAFSRTGVILIRTVYREYLLSRDHSVIFYHIALSMQTCHMLMAEPSTYDMFAFLKKNGYVDGWAVNIWHVFLLFSNKRNKKLSYVDGWAVNISVLFQKWKHVICWRLSHQHMTCLLS